MRFIDSKFVAIAFVGIMLGMSVVSCKGITGKKTGVDSDSVAAAKVDKVMLPDTAFASVDDLTYDVELIDTVTSGILDNLINPYDTVPGVFTFRGGQRRDARTYSGKIKGTPNRIVQDWVFRTSARGSWGGGSGWTGEPVYVKWPKEQMDKFRQSSPALTADFSEEEIIVGSLCEQLYFLNFANGKESRKSIEVGNPVKGSVSLDPALNGSLYVGQGIPTQSPFGHLSVDLYKHERVYMWDRDPKAKRGWGAYDSSPVVAGQFLFWPGENGSIYKYSRLGNGQLKMHSALRYVIKGDGGAGIESSMAIYKNYGFVGDNHGDILCINLNTMKPVWHYDNHDDIDGSIVLEVEKDVPYIYCGCEVDLQGGSDKRTHFVKLNALSGTKVWEWSCPSAKVNVRDSHFDGGLYCTPLIGDGDCKNMIFASFNQLDGSKNSEFLAFDKNSGNLLYRKPLTFFAWSSPVGFYNEKNELYIVIGNSSGHLYFIRGKDGEILFDQVMSSNFESSPIVKDNIMVVGSRDGGIYRFHVE